MMHEEPVKICPNCGAEYSPEAMMCADCGEGLIFSQEYEKRSIPLEATGTEALLRQGPAGYLRELGELLAQNGIRSAIQFHGCEPGT